MTWDDCVLSLTTGPAAASIAVVDGYLKVYLNQEEAVSVTINAAFATPTAGSKQVLGVGDGEAGVFFGYNGLRFGMLATIGGSKRYWKFQVTSGCTTSGAITLTLLDQAYTFPVAAGMTVMQVMYSLVSSQIFSDANIHVFAAPDSLTLYTDYCGTFGPVTPDSVDVSTTGISATIEVLNGGNPPARTWIYSDQFTETGRDLPNQVDMTQFQVYQLVFSRWSSAPICLSMLDTNRNNTYRPLHLYLPGANGFNTSKPYTPHIFIRNSSDILSEAPNTTALTLRTSMANITSGTPSSNTNSTVFSTTFMVNQITVNDTSQLVIGAVQVPLILNGKRNHCTSSITDITVSVNASRSVQLRVIASGGLSSPITTSASVPWSTLLHGVPTTPTYVQQGLTITTMNVNSASVETIELKQLWLAPGTTAYFAIIASPGAPIIADVNALITWNES